MFKQGIPQQALAKLLEKDRQTVNNKINGHCKWYLDEAEIIRKTFFPKLDLGYLFKKE
ncbi:MAG: XRE family transcriptional regulator [Bacteroidota bacterium]